MKSLLPQVDPYGADNHNLPRRRLMLGLGAVSFGFALPSPGFGQSTYPSRPITIVCPQSAGGASDIVTRLIARNLEERFRQSVVVINKDGASTIIGAQFVAKSPPDGYCLLLTTSATMIANRVLYSKLPYDPEKDFEKISQIAAGAFVLVGQGGAPYSSLEQLRDWSRKQSNPMNYGSWGVGSAGHLFGERLRNDFGFNIRHVPYKTMSQAFLEVVSGDLDFTLGSPIGAKDLVETGKLKALAMAPARISTMSQVPSFAEQGFDGFDLSGYYGFYAPANTPKPIIDALSQACVDIVGEQKVREALIKLGSIPIGNTAAQFEVRHREEFPRWVELIKTSGVTAQ